MTIYLTPAELAERYRGAITVGTLRNWRHQRRGPSYVKIGGKVVYALADVVAWEDSCRAAGLTPPGGEHG